MAHIIVSKFGDHLPGIRGSAVLRLFVSRREFLKLAAEMAVGRMAGRPICCAPEFETTAWLGI
jgi:hypothetical protein